jgi:anti-sigma factor RsiW
MSEQRFKMGKREHRYVSDRLSAYVDGELADRERGRVETHLGGCEDCRADLRALRWTKRLLQQAPQVKIPRSFVIREADVTARRPARRRVSLFATQWATAVVALLLIVAVGGDLLSRGLWYGQSAAPMLASEEPVYTVAVEAKEAEAGVLGEIPVQPESEVARAVPMVTASPAAMPAEKAAPEGEAERMGTTTDAVSTTVAPKMMVQPETSVITTDTLGTEDVTAPDETNGEALAQVPEKETSTTAAVEVEHAAATPTLPRRDDAATVTSWGEEDLVSRQPVRLAWHAVEIVLGIALAGLLAAVIWMRRR